MNENQLKKTLNDISIREDIQERLITKCNKIAKSKNSTGYKKVLRPAIACAILLTFSFSTVFAFSADFREYIISFFKSEQIEVPPISTHANNELESNNYIRYIGHQEIESVADINYYEMTDGFLIYNGYIIVADEYYKIDKESLMPITPINVNDSIQFHDYIFDLDFKYMIEDSQIQILENKSTNSDGKVASPMWTKGTEFVWLYIGVRNEFYTCIQYNLKTGEIKDIVKESGLPIVFSKEVNGIQTTLSPNGKTMLIHNYDSRQAFLLNTQDLSYISLGAINTEGMEISLSFIDDQTLSVKKWKEEGSQDKWIYTFSSFDIASREERILLSDVPDSQRGVRLGFWGAQQGMLILVKERQYILVDPKTGEQYTIEGLKPNPDNFFLRNPDNKKIVVTSSSNQEDLSITQIGYIDMEKREFKVFDRKDFSESGMYWIGNTKLALPSNTDNKLLCIYEFK